MLLSDVQVRVQRQFGDTTGAQITTDDIARWATDAQLDIVRRTKCNLSTITTNSLAGFSTYQLDRVLDVSNLEYAGVRLRQITAAELQQRFPNRHVPGYYADTPMFFTVSETGVELFPTPVVSGDSIVVTHIRRPVDVVVPTDQFEIPAQYHEDIVTRCIQRAYELDGQWQASDRKSQEYTARLAVSAADAKDKNDDSYPSIRCLPGDYGWG